jgi:O-antigen/teichoic acid export membrane protein
MKERLFDTLGITSDRTKDITKHISLSFVYKAGSILGNFLLVPLTIGYLDTNNYGIWLLITSFVGWFTFFDIGLGHGLRNKFTEAKASDGGHLIQSYVSSAYFSMGFISLGLIALFLGVNPFVNWSSVFNTSESINQDLAVLMLIVFVCFCTQLVLKLITSIYTADLQPSKQDLINFLTQMLSVALIFIITQTSESSLMLFGIVFSLIPVSILLGFSVLSFSTKYKEYRPSFKFFDKKQVSEVFGLGIKFFVIQVSGVVIYSTDNLIITQLFGPEEVVPYNIAFKYFSIITIGFLVILKPYWSAITEAYSKAEFEWIEKSMKSMTKITILFLFGAFFLLIGSDYFYSLWLGDQVSIPFRLSFLMSLFVSVQTIMTPVIYFINGTGKVKLQLVVLAITSLLNIPLSVILAKYFGLGSAGVMLATVLCLFPVLVITRVQYKRVMSGTAKGIWND